MVLCNLEKRKNNYVVQRKKETFVFYMKKVQVIGHLFTLTQL